MKQSAVVTGGASGIGFAAVERLLQDGWPVAVLDADDNLLAEAEDALVDEEVVFVRADVTDEEEVAEAFDQVVDRFGLIGGLVNAASVRREAIFEETTAEMLREALEINVVGTFIPCKAALERMGQSLSIVNVGSVAGLRASPGHAALGASVAGLRLLTEALAVEFGRRSVRANLVAPGLVDDVFGASIDPKTWLDRVPQGRYGTVPEVAAAIAFLLSPEAAYINGQTIAVDGGLSASGLRA
ncbi:MAG: SDR family oxidoreductase [Rhizobiaceae bacterium]|nr:SDR family oxidoreductase [Rhizobiaceae bacterium]